MSEVRNLQVAQVRAMLKRPVAFHPVLARICDSVTAGLMLCQALYWTERTQNREGWFYKTRNEWNDEICLGRFEQEGARKRLRDYGFIEEMHRGIPRRVYFRVNLIAVLKAIEQLTSTDPVSSLDENGPTTRLEPVQQLGGKPANRTTEKCPPGRRTTSHPYKEAEISTESTAETKQKENSTPNGALRTWLSIKASLEHRIAQDEWNLWVRPARLAKVMDGNTMLVSLPPNTKILQQARVRLHMVREISRPLGYEVHFTIYPDEHQLERIAEQFPTFYAQMYGTRRRNEIET